MRHLFAFAFLLWGSTNALWAQHTLSGRITTGNNEPLPGSHIHAAGRYAVSDADGRYRLSLPEGEHMVSVTFVGFRKSEKAIRLTTDATLDFMLFPDVSILSDVAVRSVPKSAAAEQKTVLTQRDAERYSNASLGDLVREVSGVSSLKTGSTVVKPVINGLHSSRVLLISHNVRLEDQQWGIEHAPNLDVNTAGRISVIKGAAGLQYGGDAVGGVILVDPVKVPLADTLYGRAILNSASNGRGGSLSSSVTKGYAGGWHWNLQGTFKYLGDLETPGYVLSNTGIRERDFSVGFGHRGDHSGFDVFYSFYNADIGILRASHIGNITDLVNAINSGEPSVVRPHTHAIGSPRQEVIHHLAKAHYYRDWHSGRLDLQYAFQFNNRQEFDIRRGDDRNRAALDLGLMTQSVLADFTSDAGRDFRFKTGISGSYQNNVAQRSTGIRPLIPDYERWEAGAYGTFSWDFAPKWQAEAGVRYDFSHIDAVKYYLKSRWAERGYEADFADFITGDFGTQWKTHPVFRYHNLSAVAGLKRTLSDKLDWAANLSLARRNPNPSELFSDGLHHATGQIELGDLRMRQETSVKVSTVLTYSGKNLRLEVNPYLHRIANFMYLQPTGLEYTIRGAFPVWEYRSTDARLSGIDLTADWDATPQINLRSTFAYVNGKDTRSGRPLIDMPPMNWNNALRFFKKEWHGLTLQLRSEWSFFQDRYPDNDFTADVIVEGNPAPVTVAISRPPKAYQLLHFQSEITLDTFRDSKLTLAFGVQNLLDTSYRDYLNRMRFYADDMGRNFTFQLKIHF